MTTSGRTRVPKKTDIAKWQIFWVDGRINHIVNMDNVTFVEVVDE